jgi:2',3'-cyclic-nucleotide 2'-phosphodiesterase (5'-nucleotidase family)
MTADGRIAERGGFARLKTAIGRVLVSYPDSYILDAGDFSMGTLYQTIFSSEAPDVRIMGRLGFDAAVLGNHEFDYRPRGLTDMLNAAVGHGGALPALLLANIDWDRTLADESRAAEARELRAAMDNYGVVQSYAIIEKGGVRAAIFGILGRQADSNAPESGLYFIDPITAAGEIVAQIKAEANADIIICLSHGRLNSDSGRSECELLAKAVPDIDVIVSGHSHTRLEAPIVHGSTYIISSGEHTYNLGHITLARDINNRYRVTGYDLIPVSQDLPADAEISAAVLEFRELVNSGYLSKFGYSYNQVLAYSPYNFTPIENFGNIQGEDTLGNLISDSYFYAVAKAEGENHRPIDVAIAPNGVIRASLTQGPITVADAFNVSSLGIGPDRIPGYPLVSVYLTGRELKTIAEIDISVSTLMSAARLYISGLTYTYNPHRLLLNRVTDVRLARPGGTTEKIENNKLYRIIGGLYSCQMLGEVESQSFGLLKVTPKDADGNPITNFEDHIIYDGDIELKEWAALAGYLESFDINADGIPQIPEYYNTLQGRKIEEKSLNPIALLKNPNHIFFMLLGAVLLAAAIITVPAVLIIRKVRLKKKSN